MKRETTLLLQFKFTNVLLLAFALIFWTGCTPKSAEKPAAKQAVETLNASNKVHVAFAGGGWRAHSGHSGWTISLLNNGNRSLKDAFSNVQTISSNSGGSWFSTMLTYSSSFVNDIQAANAINTWGQTGWLGKQQGYFDAAYCHALSGDAFLACVFETYSSGTRWNSVVEDLVFKDYSLGRQTLSGSHQSWASDKALLLASTMLTSQVVLNGTMTGNKSYYQACIAPGKPVLNGGNGSSCSNQWNDDVSPVTFSSIPSGLGLSAPNFLKAAGSQSQFSVGYTQNADPAPIASAQLKNPLSNDQVPVMLGAAASSAAGGFAASAKVSGAWITSYEGEDEALAFSLANNSVQFTDPTNMTVDELANNKVVRLADGGPVDNSGVAQLMAFLQQNNLDDGFNIVAFDNVMELYKPSNAAVVGSDIANLFGESVCSGSTFCSGVNCKGTCIKIPNIQIFDNQSVNSTQHTWAKSTGSTKYDQRVIYTQYKVTTVDNSNFGITKGSTGTLHAFTCMWSNADTAPQNNTQDGDFNAYNNMLNFIHSSLSENSGEGLKYLETALGL